MNHSQNSAGAEQGASVTEDTADGLERWHGPAATVDVLAALSHDGVHLLEDGVARDVANTIQSAVGGWVRGSKQSS